MCGFCRRSKQPLSLLHGEVWLPRGRTRKQRLARSWLVTVWLTCGCSPSRTLFVGKRGLEQAKQAIISYKTGQTKEMTPQLWQAKKIVDSTLHPGMD